MIFVEFQGCVYSKHHRQRCDKSAMKLVVLFSLKTVESLENGMAMRRVSLLSSESPNSVDADAWYKQALKPFETVL